MLPFSFQIWLSVRCPRPYHCHRHYCEKLKSMWENLGASLRSYVDSKQLFTILDCKILVQYYFMQLKIIASWRLPEYPYLIMLLKASFQVALQIMLTMAVSIASWEKLILSYFRASRSQVRFMWPSPSLDKYRRSETEKADFEESQANLLR